MPSAPPSPAEAPTWPPSSPVDKKGGGRAGEEELSGVSTDGGEEGKNGDEGRQAAREGAVRGEIRRRRRARKWRAERRGGEADDCRCAAPGPCVNNQYAITGHASAEKGGKEELGGHEIPPGCRGAKCRRPFQCALPCALFSSAAPPTAAPRLPQWDQAL